MTRRDELRAAMLRGMEKQRRDLAEVPRLCVFTTTSDDREYQAWLQRAARRADRMLHRLNELAANPCRIMHEPQEPPE